MRKKYLLVIACVILILAGLVVWQAFNGTASVSAATTIFASPVQAGCYIAGPNDCRIHVEPFTIDLGSGTKLVFFQLLSNSPSSGTQVIYDFRPDLSNPVPFSGNTFTPSLVAQDFAATCGRTYAINLQGRDTGDPSPFNLGGTGQFTCPASVP